MKAFLLTYFDNIVGPRIFLKVPEQVNESITKNIPMLMNLYQEGFFIHEFGTFKSANLFFEISSKKARGGAEMLMATIVVSGEQGEINTRLTKTYLEKFAEEMNKVKNAYKGFYMGSNSQKGDEKVFENIKELFYSFYESLPDITILNPIKADIFVFGLSKVGKTTIIHVLQNKVIKEMNPTISMDVSKYLIENVSFMIYDAPGQEKYRKLWAPHLNNQDGLVFVLDVSDVKAYEEASKVFKEIAFRPEMRDLPVLILLNKVDLKKPDVNKIKKLLDLKSLKANTNNYKIFNTCALKNQGIFDAFEWLAKNIAQGKK
ncbi:MAG: ADP-ribosylation factor-like protein [Promethearchaeota archaeon]